MRKGRKLALLATVVAGVFVAWSVVLLVQVAAAQRELGRNVATLRQLELLNRRVVALEDVVLDHVDGAELGTLASEWDRAYAAYRSDRAPLDGVAVVASRLVEADRNVTAMEQLHRQTASALVVGRPTRGLERQLRDHRRHANDAIWQALGDVRGQTDQIAMGLASRWNQINVLVIVSCVMAFGLALCVLALRRAVRTATANALAHRKSECRLRLITEQSDEIFWLVTRDEQEILYASPAYEQLLHADIHQDDRQRMADAKARSKTPATDERDNEVRVLQPDGSHRWMWLRSRPVYNDQGAFVARVGSAVDITRRRDAEEHVRRLSSAVEQSVDGIAVADIGARVIFVNKAWADMHGVDPEQQVGRHLSVFHTPQQWREDVRPFIRKLETKGYNEGEIGHVRADGTVLETHMSVTMLRDEGSVEAGYVVVARDDTHRRRQDAELRQRAERERRLLLELGHRVRNNLLSLETLIDLTAEDAGDTRRFAASIKGRVRAMSRVHEMLSTSRWMPVSMRRLVLALTDPGQAGRVICVGADIQIPASQSTALGMVIHELMTNSARHGALGSETGRVRVNWTETSDDHGVRRCRLEWQEQDGPPITTAPRPSLGTRLIDGLVGSDLRGSATLTYPESGARHEIELTLERPGVSIDVGTTVCEVKWPTASTPAASAPA
jgi:PAS domain S-box-containing protein